MQILEERAEAPSVKELKRLVAIANDGFLLGWLVDVQESLAEASEQIVETYSRLDELKQSLASGQPRMTETERRQIGMIVMRVIAFNNRSAQEKTAFDAVGLGSCAYELDTCIKEVRKAWRLAVKSKNEKG